jgi:hypothetical protein
MSDLPVVVPDDTPNHRREQSGYRHDHDCGKEGKCLAT